MTGSRLQGARDAALSTLELQCLLATSRNESNRVATNVVPGTLVLRSGIGQSHDDEVARAPSPAGRVAWPPKRHVGLRRCARGLGRATSVGSHDCRLVVLNRCDAVGQDEIADANGAARLQL